MPNHCENFTTLQFKNKTTKDSFLQDLQEVLLFEREDFSSGGLCQLAIPFDLNRVVVLREQERQWGTKWGTYEHNICEMQSLDENIVELMYLTAWTPFSITVTEKLIHKYDLINIKTIYHEPGNCLAGVIDCSPDDNIENEFIVSSRKSEVSAEFLEYMTLAMFQQVLTQSGYNLSTDIVKQMFAHAKQSYEYFYTEIDTEVKNTFIDESVPNLSDIVNKFTKLIKTS